MNEEINVVGVYKDKSRGLTQSFLLSEFIEEIKDILTIEEVHQVKVDEDGNYQTVPLGRLKITFEPVIAEARVDSLQGNIDGLAEPVLIEDPPDAVVSRVMSISKKRGPKPGSKNKKKAAERKKPAAKKAKGKKVSDL